MKTRSHLSQTQPASGPHARFGQKKTRQNGLPGSCSTGAVASRVLCVTREHRRTYVSSRRTKKYNIFNELCQYLYCGYILTLVSLAQFLKGLWLLPAGERKVVLTVAENPAFLQKEIADRLGLRPDTVAHYLRRAYGMMRIRGRCELVGVYHAWRGTPVEELFSEILRLPPKELLGKRRVQLALI